MFAFLQKGIRPGTAEIPAGRVVYAVGDVHGRDDLLSEALDRITADFKASGATEGTVVLLGDLIDRGPGSFRAVRLARTFDVPGLELVTLMGNHEEAFVRFMNEPLERRVSWMGREAKATLKEIGVEVSEADLAAPDALRDRILSSIDQDDLAYLKGLPRIHRIGDVTFTHAGLDRKVALERQDERTLTWGLSDRPAGSYASMVVHGHYATEKPEISGSFVSIDTEAWKSGVLTTFRIQGKAFSIDAVTI
jgi:serine/threonine protein phosphatase 1